MSFFKKTFLVTLLLTAVFVVAPHVFAQTQPEQFVPLAPIPHLTDTGTVGTIINSHSFSAFFTQLYKYLIGIAVILAIVMIIWSGVEIAMNKDSVSKTIASKGRINNAIFGLILVLAPALVFGIINPSILNLNVNFSPVNLTSSPYTQTNTGASASAGTTSTDSSGVTQTVTGTYLKTATFSGKDADTLNAAMSTWIDSCPRIPVMPGLSNLGETGFNKSANSSCVVTDSGKVCTATNAVAFCSSTFSPAYYFVDISGTYQYGAVLRPLSTGTKASAESVSAFEATCSSDGGTTCIAKGTDTALDSCPAGTQENTSGTTGVLTGDASGTCHTAELFCTRSGDAAYCNKYSDALAH